MSKPTIVSGEAPETDSEDETSPKQLVKTVAPIPGAVIAGEDSESDNENDASICSAVSALNATSLSPRKEDPTKKYDSLLHQKLRECNGKLHQDMTAFCQNVIGDAGKNLNSIDQQLIKSQLTVQNAVTSLKSLGTNSFVIKNKLQSLLSAQFLSNIKLNK